MLSLALFDTDKEYSTVLISDKDILISSVYYKQYSKDENINNLPASGTLLLIPMLCICG